MQRACHPLIAHSSIDAFAAAPARRDTRAGQGSRAITAYSSRGRAGSARLRPAAAEGAGQPLILWSKPRRAGRSNWSFDQRSPQRRPTVDAPPAANARRIADDWLMPIKASADRGA